MPYASISEVIVCLKDCITYCKEHPERDYCERFAPQLIDLQRELNEAWETSDRRFADWRKETGEDKLSWKKLARTLRDVQNRLEKVDAIGYPNERVMYWDAPVLEKAVDDMVAYLRDRTDDIDFAQDYIDRMEQLRDVAHTEHDESSDALRDYQNHFRARRDTLSQAAHLIGAFRDEMRSHLSEDHSDYQNIRWAWSISPDETVL